MSRTKRSKDSEVLRQAAPYKRTKRSQLLKQFEVSYIETNQDPAIQLD